MSIKISTSFEILLRDPPNNYLYPYQKNVYDYILINGAGKTFHRKWHKAPIILLFPKKEREFYARKSWCDHEWSRAREEYGGWPPQEEPEAVEWGEYETLTL